MDWEIINGVTGIVSMLCSILGLGYFGSVKSDSYARSRGTITGLMAFLLSSSGWSLLCLCFFWMFQPFGRFVSDDEFFILYSVILSFPGFVVFIVGFKQLKKL